MKQKVGSLKNKFENPLANLTKRKNRLKITKSEMLGKYSVLLLSCISRVTVFLFQNEVGVALKPSKLFCRYWQTDSKIYAVIQKIHCREFGLEGQE